MIFGYIDNIHFMGNIDNIDTIAITSLSDIIHIIGRIDNMDST